ncbi:MAG: transcription antitermination factor NusB, partial [Burkholderiales bacterium]
MTEAQRLASLAVNQVLVGRNLTAALSTLSKRHPGLSAPQRALAQELAYGTLRFYGELQTLLTLLLQKPLQNAELRALLLVGLYQLHYGKAVPYAVVDHAVNAAAALNQRAAKGLVNAVLRNFLRRRKELLALAHAAEAGRYSHPQWWIDKLKTQYPADFERILVAANQRPPMTLRVNSRVTTKHDYLRLLQNAEIEAEDIGDYALKLRHPVTVEKLPGFFEGMVSVQD